MATYRDSGVDIDAAEAAVNLIRPVAEDTYRPEVMGGVGPFAGLFRLDLARYREPVLVSSTDGVGTKVLLAAAYGRHRSLGTDLVNHCVNDVLTAGADPLFFLDYIGVGLLEPPLVLELVSGIAEACRESGCTLIGGETAEMPGLYAAKTYDLAGFLVGACERSELIDPSTIEAGDTVLALPSNGLHTNGYSLARRVIPSQALNRQLGSGPSTVLDALLQAHTSYLEPVRRLRASVRVKGLAHITGGGIPGNLRRIMPAGCGADIAMGTWPEPEIFSYLRPFVPDEEMWRTFNMGLGMAVVVAPADAPAALHTLNDGIFMVGRVVESPERLVRIVD
jgi:phosphoribosylformylglycinamidine cyclo-ligase